MKKREKMVQRTILLPPAEMHKVEQIVQQSVQGITVNDVVRVAVAHMPANVQLTAKGLRRI